MESYTMKDLRRQLIIIDAVRKALNIDSDLAYGLEEGSKTYGRAFKLYGIKDGGHGAHYSVSLTGGGFGSIGWTKNEAFGILVAMKESLMAAAAGMGVDWDYPDTTAL